MRENLDILLRILSYWEHSIFKRNKKISCVHTEIVQNWNEKDFDFFGVCALCSFVFQVREARFHI